MCARPSVCVSWFSESAQYFSNSGESKTNYQEKTQTVHSINWAQMEAGNKREQGEDTWRNTGTQRRTAQSNRDTTESDRQRAG